MLGGCTLSSESIEFDRAEKAQQEHKYELAVQHYKKVVDRFEKTDLAIQSALQAGRLSYYELRKFKEAIGFYRHVILYGSKAEDRLLAQQKIADLYFLQLSDYGQAIIEFNRLLDLPHSREQGFQYHFSIAKSYFYQSNFFQALVEVDQILKDYGDHPPLKDAIFDVQLLKANIHLTTKKLDEAVQVLQEMTEKYPERAQKESLGLVLAVSYEEQKNFLKAIEVLEGMKDSYPRKEFIEKRIQTLKERATYLPGAKGFRK